MMMDAMMMTRIGGVVVAATYRLSRLVTRPETTTPRPRQDHDGGDGRRAREEGAKPRALTLTVRGPEREDAVDVLYILSDTERAFFFQGNAFSNNALFFGDRTEGRIRRVGDGDRRARSRRRARARGEWGEEVRDLVFALTPWGEAGTPDIFFSIEPTVLDSLECL